MRKPVKYALLGVGGAAILVIGAVVVFALTFDPNRYKGQIEAAVKEKTGRTLKLAGNLELAFWPSLGAKVAGVTLSEKGSEQDFVALESAHASVAVLPLLHGAVLVDGIRVAGLKANVVKDKQGKFNFSDLLEGGAEKPAAPAPQEKKGGESGGPVGFDIASVRIERSSVAYRDLASGQELSLSDIDLSTGRIAEKADGKLKFSVQAKGRNPDLDAKVQLSGEYKVDLPAKSYALSDVDGKVTGTVAKEPLEAKLSAPRISIAADSAKGDAVTIEAKLGARQVNLKIAGLEGSAKALSIPKLSAQVSMPMPDLPQKTLQANIEGSLKADLEKQSANADLVIKVDESTIKAKLALPKFSPPAYNFDVDIDKLNVDRYMAASAEPAKEAKKGPEKPAAQQQTPVDLSALKGLNANGKLHIGALQARGLKVADVRAEVKAANGRVDVAPHSASLYEGKVAGALSLQADGNRITLKEDLTGVAIGPLLKDVAQKDLLAGKGNIALDVNAAGPTVEAMKKALAGSARVALKDGAIKGFNLAEALRKAKAAFGSKEEKVAADQTKQTDFSEMSASFAIKNGVAHNEDLDVKAPLFRIAGKGDIDIGNSSLDYTTKATVVGTTKGQGGAELESLSGLTVPVHLSGSFDALKYDVNYGAVAADLAKSKAGEKAKVSIEKNRDKIEERLGSKLKGLIGR